MDKLDYIWVGLVFNNATLNTQKEDRDDDHRKKDAARETGEEAEENTKRKKNHAFITAIYFGLKVGFFLSRRQKRWRMML